MKKKFIIGGAIVILLIIGGWLVSSGMFYTLYQFGGQSGQGSENEKVDWLNFELTDVRNGNKFTLMGLASEGKPVLVETFATWCSTCKKQQNILKGLHNSEIGDDFISVGLNTDPNEDQDLVKGYIEDNGFDWRYSVTSSEMTRALIDTFGIGIVNAPSAPIIFICKDGSFRKLDGFGVKSSEKLKEEIKGGC